MQTKKPHLPINYIPTKQLITKPQTRMQGKSLSEMMKWNSVIGTILHRGATNLLRLSSSSVLLETATPLASVISSPGFPISRKLLTGNPSFATTATSFHVSTPLQFNRSFSSSADKSLPAVYYFTVVWCGT
ncbi:hypothetical protein LINPERHAP2_LOCUS3372 [Linum perenne]